MSHEEDRVDVAQVRSAARGRPVGLLRRLRNDVRVRADERVPLSRFVAEPLDDRERMADRLVLRLAVPRIGPREHAFPLRRAALPRPPAALAARALARPALWPVAAWPCADVVSGASQNNETDGHEREREKTTRHFWSWLRSSYCSAKRDHGVRRRAAQESAAARGHGDVLLAVLADIGRRDRVRGRFELLAPELLAVACVDRAEDAVNRRADEDEVAGGRDAAAETRLPGLDALGLELLELAERNAPGDVAGVGVDRDQLAPRRLGAAVLVCGSQKRPPSGVTLLMFGTRAYRGD